MRTFYYVQGMVITLAIALSCIAPVRSYASTTPGGAIGPEVRVNFYDFTHEGAGTPAMAMDAVGNFVITFLGNAYAEDSGGVYARLYSADGAPKGPEILVNTIPFQGGYPRIAMAPSGEFAIVWEISQDEHLRPTSGIDGRLFDEHGDPLGPEFTVTTGLREDGVTYNNVGYPNLAMDALGRFAVVWTADKADYAGGATQPSWVIAAQRFNADGTYAGPELRVDAAPPSYSSYAPDIGMDGAGNFTIAWNSQNTDDANEVVAQRYEWGGMPIGTASSIVSKEVGEAYYESTLADSVSLAMNSLGDYVSTWIHSFDDPYYAHHLPVRLRAFSSDNSPRTDRIEIPDAANMHPARSKLAISAKGDFARCWERYATDLTFHVFVQRFDAMGNALSPEIDVRPDAPPEESYANCAVALDADGDLVVAWQDIVADKAGRNLHLRRYAGYEDVGLSVFLESGSSPATVGVPLVYRVAVDNHHAAVAPTGVSAVDDAMGSATDVSVSLNLPDGLNFNSVQGEGWSCSQSNQTLDCRLGTPIRAQASSSFDLNLDAPASPGSVHVAATMNAAQFDSLQADNTAELTVIIDPPPASGGTSGTGSGANAGQDTSTGSGSGAGAFSVIQLALFLLFAGTRAIKMRPGIPGRCTKC